MLSRRTLVALALLAASPAGAADIEARLADLERRYGGRLGVAILDTGTGRAIAHRGDERFPICSTFKALAVACVLARVDAGKESLARRVAYAKGDLLSYAPVTSTHLADGLTVGELCAAAIVLSDNTAANLLLQSFGGPAGLTAYLRTLGDDTTRLDRTETALNEALPGDPRDTSTPVAMARTLRKLVLGDALSTASRTQLTDWLVACETGTKKIRAGVPAGWRVGDKTGSGERNTSNDVAILWPPGRAPLVVVAFSTGSTGKTDALNPMFAEVGRLASG